MKERRWMEKLMNYLIMNCISYTVTSFVLSLLSAFKIVQNMDYHILLQLLICTSVISLVMFFDSKRKELILGLMCGIIVVLCLGGGVFHRFPWSASYVIMVILIFIVSYLVSYSIRLVENKVMTDKINYVIKEKRK